MSSGEMARYSMTKTMNLSLAKSLSKLTKGTNVTVNTIAGFDFNRRSRGYDTKNVSKQYNSERNGSLTLCEESQIRFLRFSALSARKKSKDLQRIYPVLLHLLSPAPH